MLYAYLDESGTHAASPVIMIGGAIARLETWEALEPDWIERLRNQGAEYFHASQCEAGDGIFAGIPDRKALFAGCAEVIAKNQPLARSCR